MYPGSIAISPDQKKKTKKNASLAHKLRNVLCAHETYVHRSTSNLVYPSAIQ